jgi:hypothetical protein
LKENTGIRLLNQNPHGIKGEDMLELEAAKLGLSGTVASWEVVNPDGTIADASYTPHHNLILDVGLDMVAAYNIYDLFAYMALGTGTSESATTMTTLESEPFYDVGAGMMRPAASGYSAYDDTDIPDASADPFVVVISKGIQTNVGVLNGTYTELGFSPTATKDTNLYSRFRIKDSGGNPVSITVSSVQQLRLKYQLSVQVLPITATAGTFDITGYGTGVGYTALWQNIHYSPTATYPVWKYGHCLFLCGTLGFAAKYDADFSFRPLTDDYNLSNTIGNDSLEAYTASSYTRYITYTLTTLQAVGNIYGIAINAYNGANPIWLAHFNTPIVKPDTHNLSFRLKFQWARAT